MEIILPGLVLVRQQLHYSRECTVNNLVEGAAGRGSCWGQSGFLLRQRSVDTHKEMVFSLTGHLSFNFECISGDSTPGGDTRQKEGFAKLKG